MTTQNSNIRSNNFNELKNSLAEYIHGKISYSELKAVTVPLGIYRQRDRKFMIRIRVSAGELTLQNLIFISELAESYPYEYLHLTTRQDIQLHGVKAENIFSIVSECNHHDIPFKGGGGDTFRNITACYNSGFSPNSVFDVTPYAKFLTEYFYNYKKVYNLPRKLKIAFSCNEEDKSFARFQDLGFIACKENNKKGFKVYVAGGMGKCSMPGIKVFDFIPESQFVNCAIAVANLFYEHGNRKNRNKARLRFLAKEMGPNEFIKLLKKYYTQTTKKPGSPVSIRTCPCKSVFFYKSVSGPPIISDLPNFKNWEKYAVEGTTFKEIALVKLFIPNGRLDQNATKKIIEIMSYFNIPFLRLTREQNACIPINKSAVPTLFQKLTKHKKIIDLAGSSMNGLITSCIGTEVCPVGIIDPTPFADSIASELDNYFTRNPEKYRLLPNIISDIKISGCSNCCSNHPAADIGLQGIRRKNKDGTTTDYCKVFKHTHFTHNKEIATINAAEAGRFIVDLLTYNTIE